MIKYAWTCVSKETIANCWSHCDILVNLDQADLQTTRARRDEEVVSSLDGLIKELREKYSYKSKASFETMSASEFIDQDVSEPTGELLEESDIIELVKNHNN
jgi:hypothetical protein